MTDTTMSTVSYHANKIACDASTAFWLDGCDGDDAPSRARLMRRNIDEALTSIADLLGYELTKKPTDKES